MVDYYSSNNPRIPLGFQGVQVNFCKNPTCPNFGVPAKPDKTSKADRDTYTIVGSTKSAEKINVPVLSCKLCGEYPPIKSNAGIFEEYERISGYLLNSPRQPSCPNEDCPNHDVGVSPRRGHYQKWTDTKSGSKRLRCKACGKVFALPRATGQQRLAFKNPQLFRLLVNKVPIRRICDILDISPKTFYDKLDFIHQKCLDFAAAREIKLLDGTVSPRRLYVSVDRQDHLVNWSQRKDKRNTQFHAIGSADNLTGYVFGTHLNFDSSLDPAFIENEALSGGDYRLKPPHRKFARLWLAGDYSKAVLEKALELTKIRNEALKAGLVPGIVATYREAAAREDVEAFDLPSETLKFPSDGMMVHAEYTLYAHFLLLQRMFAHNEHVRFFLDQESGIRAACMAAFHERIMAGSCEAYYVKINKELTVNQKRKIMADLRFEYDERREKLGIHDISDTSIRRMMIEEKIDDMRPMGPWRDMWIEVPSHSMSEPEKQVCLLTDVTHYDRQRLSIILDRASLHGIDRFFMQVRRLMSITERPISSASNTGRKWQQYGAYKPTVLAKMLDIFRVYYNFCKVGDDGKTPAMRLGLARRPIKVEKVLRHQAVSVPWLAYD